MSIKIRPGLVLLAIIVVTGLVLAVGSSSPTEAQQTPTTPKLASPLTVMTRNVYHGVDAEFARAAVARNFSEFVTATGAVFNGYHERNLPERAGGLAAEIQETQPDVVGLQEVVMVRTDTPADGRATPANELSLDYLQILLDRLQERGLHYTPVVQSINWDIEAPTALGFDLRHTDRIAMLIRTEQDSGLEVLGTNSGHFKATCKLPTAAVGPIEIVRGWTSVDLSIRGKTVRFINTHLDGDCSDPAIQLAQAQEIVRGPVQEARDENLPVILLGDLNSKADGSGTPTYSELLKPKVGFVDTWTEGGSGSGFTCCQNDDLRNTESVLSDRRDFVLFRRGPFQVIDAQVVGADPADRTPSGLWPSDHAGVVVELRLPPEDNATAPSTVSPEAVTLSTTASAQPIATGPPATKPPAAATAQPLP
jgi:endonuclease/exonuclease/phosphatase family metal-dependent hydrolase